VSSVLLFVRLAVPEGEEQGEEGKEKKRKKMKK
jgi:hypothetical protein